MNQDEIARKPYLEMLALELKEIDEKAKESWISLLRLIYDKYPSKNEAKIYAGELNEKNATKALKKAIFDYHSDRVQDKSDIKKITFHDEIVKRLNEAYGRFKDFDA